MRRLLLRRLPGPAVMPVAGAALSAATLLGVSSCGAGGSDGAGESAGGTAEAGEESAAEADSGEDAEAVDVTASESGLESAGYACESGTCTRSESGVAYTVKLAEDSLEAEVRETGSQTALHPHYDTLLTDLGKAVKPGEYAGMSWAEIRDWANAHADSSDHETSGGSWTVAARFDDTTGSRARQLVITRT